MGLTAAHQPRFRVFCCLLAALWAAMILLGAVRLACAAPAALRVPLKAAASSAVCRCPMCAAMQMAGMKPGMKCCCHNGGTPSASCFCQCRPQPQAAATLAVLIWSPVAVLPDTLGVPPPFYQPRRYPPLFPRFDTLARAPLPRPPRFL